MTRSGRGIIRELAQTAVVRRPRVRLHPMATLMLSLWLLSTVGVLVAQADDPAPTTPTGLGDLVPLPDLTGGGSKSLFEESGPLAWSIDSNPGITNFIALAFAGLVSQVWYLALALAYGAIALVYWLLSLTSMDVVTEPLSAAIGAGSQALLAWLMPSAVVIGLLIAWIRHRGHDMANAISWVLISAVLGISLAVSPNMWVTGVNNIRSVGADAILVSTSAAVSPDQKQPFEWPATNYGEFGGDNAQTPAATKNVMLRRTADATWRGLIATPWCAIEFGSLEACKRYGAGIIKAGADRQKRQEYIEKTIVPQEGGKDAPTVLWINGENWPERLALATVTLVMIVIFCGTLLILGFSALAAMISAMFHLLVGGFFALTWCIPGRPREIGMRWLESLIGTIIQGLIALATFSALLVLISAIFAQSATWGWLPTSIVAIAAGLTALKFRRQVESFFGVVSGGRAGAAILGATAMKLVSRGMRRAPAPSAPRPPRSTGGTGAAGPRQPGPSLRPGPRPRITSGGPRRSAGAPTPSAPAPMGTDTGARGSAQNTASSPAATTTPSRRHRETAASTKSGPRATTRPTSTRRRDAVAPPPRRTAQASTPAKANTASTSTAATAGSRTDKRPTAPAPVRRSEPGTRARAQTQRAVGPRRRPSSDGDRRA